MTIIKEGFEISREAIKFVKVSPQPNTKLKTVRSAKSKTEKSVHAFWPTRQTVRGETPNTVLNNFELWDWSLQNLSDTEMKSRIRRIYTYMEMFSYLFDVLLEKKF